MKKTQDEIKNQGGTKSKQNQNRTWPSSAIRFLPPPPPPLAPFGCPSDR